MTAIFNVIEQVIDAFAINGIAYAIGGCFASMAWGSPRQTNNLDVATLITLDQSQKIIDELGEGRFPFLHQNKLGFTRQKTLSW